jgi:hypothetical protein
VTALRASRASGSGLFARSIKRFVEKALERIVPLLKAKAGT